MMLMPLWLSWCRLALSLVTVTIQLSSPAPTCQAALLSVPAPTVLERRDDSLSGRTFDLYVSFSLIAQ